MIGKTISHYKILEKLGEGGMGQVYKAEDTKLKRIVALKFLPHHLVAGKSIKERFFHEARAASALNHPNIITIYDIHEEDGEVFLAMECVDGVLLSDKLKDGPLKQQELISIATGIADGLNAAHNAEITHRDIKSENIFITKDGLAKIIDFGLAKQKGMSQITQDGSTLGTQGYMSPEQVQGVEADRRSDIFSFGVVLYQMATGKLPFEGEHEAAVLYSIVNEAPIPVTTHNPNIDAELQRIINKALEKDVKDRYQHADDLLADLRKLKKSSTPKPTKAKPPKWRILLYILGVVSIGLSLYLTFIKKDTLPTEHVLGSKSIAVLPFTAIDRTEESEIFSEGIHDDILSQVAKISDLIVIGRTSVLKYKGTKKSLSEIAQELGVKTLLEGSVRRSGEKVRIVAQLIDADTEGHIWTETYDRDYADIFAIQSDVAQKIAVALQATLTLEEKQSINEIPTDNLEAYEFYQQGKIIFYKHWALENFESALTLFEKAIELDPDFVMAYSMLCVTHLSIYWYLEQLPNEHLQSAKLALEKAIALDPDIPDVHLAQGYYYYWGSRDYKNALKHFEQAIESQPNNSDLLAAIGFVKRRMGEWDTALEYLIDASNLDPQKSSIAWEAGITAEHMRNWKVMEQFLIRATLINPQNIRAYFRSVGLAVNGKGDLEEGRKIVEKALKYNDPKELVRLRAYVEYMNRNYQQALEICNEYRNTNIIDDSIILLYKSRIALALNQRDLATSYFDSLKTLWVKGRQSTSGDWINHYYLSMVYAGLGMKEKFLKEWELYETLMPFHKDHFTGSDYWVFKIEMLIWLGEYNQAIDLADQMLSIPSGLTVNGLKLSPIYDPLRDNPKFQKLITKYEEKG